MTIATLCDFNGVLVNDEHVHFRCFVETLAPLGINLTEEQYFTRYFALDDAGLFSTILADYQRPVSSEIVARLVETKKPLYMKIAEAQLEFFEGAKELIVRLQNMGPFIIVSGALNNEIEFALNKLGVRGLVSLIVSADDTHACKPDPAGYLKALDWLKIHHGEDSAKRSIVIEDSPGGTRAGRAAGRPVIGVLHSVDEPSLTQAGANIVVKKLPEITEALAEKVASGNYSS